MGLHIGTSGWSYKEWKGFFYPPTIKTTDWLSYYATIFDCTEINMSFYHLPKQQTVDKWANAVPEGFKFCPKMSRYVTHIKRLKNIEDSLDKFFNVFNPIANRLGPVLIQLPPSLKYDRDIVATFIQSLLIKYPMHRYALEARHESWINDDAFQLLRDNNIAWVISQSGVGFPYAEVVTANHIYLRFHGPEKLFDSSYSEEMLQYYAYRISGWLREGFDVWAFFNNTMNGHAIQNVRDIRQMISSTLSI